MNYDADVRQEKILSVARAMLDSNGVEAAGASTGERIAGALAAGRPEWAGYTDMTGYTDVIAMIDRLGPEWYDLVRDARYLIDTQRA